MACSIASITVYWIDASSFQAVVSGFANASLPCVLGSHLLFNLKDIHERDIQGSMSFESMFPSARASDISVNEEMEIRSESHRSVTVV